MYEELIHSEKLKDIMIANEFSEMFSKQTEKQEETKTTLQNLLEQ